MVHRGRGWCTEVEGGAQSSSKYDRNTYMLCNYTPQSHILNIAYLHINTTANTLCVCIQIYVHLYAHALCI